VRYSLIALVLSVTLLLAGEITFEVSVEQDDVTLSQYDGFDVVLLGGGCGAFPDGLPDLPAYAYTWVIPQGTTVTGSSVEILEEVELGDSYSINPVRAVAFNEQPGPWAPDASVYLTDEGFPGNPVTEVTNGNRTGFRIASATFVPFRYHPLSGRLSMITRATVTLYYEEDPSVPLLSLTDGQIDLARIGLETLVRNPQDLYAMAPRSSGDGKGPVWVAVGASSMETTLQPLVDHRQSTHGSAEFVTLDWIYANYTGYDTQEQIRNYLKDAFENDGLIYALIVGDFGETTRVSMLYVQGMTLNSTADLYYSDLDGTWDGDGDHLYGELTDGIDYYSDIYVGRFSAPTTTWAETMVNKTIDYETTAPSGSWRESALLCGAGLWPPQYWGSFVCDSIANRIPSNWTVTKLYENSGGHPNNQIDVINSGVSYVGPQGHGYTSGVYWYYAPDDMISGANYTQMTNIDMLCIYHSMACLAGKISNPGCIAERLMFWPSGGAIAVMFNSDNGFGTPPQVGPSEWLEIYFADQLWVQGDNEIGVTQARAKDAFKAGPGVTLKYWILQENNTLGDPAVLFAPAQTGVENPDPATPSMAVLGSPVPNPVTSSCSIGFSTPVAGSVRIAVYDLSGRVVSTLADGQVPAGAGSVTWNGASDDGNALPSGCYNVVMTAPTGTAHTRLVLVR
jgi:hypothetical protein